MHHQVSVARRAQKNADEGGVQSAGTESGIYPVVEHFYSIQGEGAWSGRAAYFIRLSGCDVGCSWCDTRYSWPAESGAPISVEILRQAVASTSCPLVVVTGGEPTMHDLGPLTRCLRSSGLHVHLETSGVYPITGTFDWITLSPKRFRPALEDNFRLASELKVVIVTRKDLAWADRLAERCGPETRLFLQPEWGTPASVPLIVDHVKSNPRWQVSLQTHKMLQVP